MTQNAAKAGAKKRPPREPEAEALPDAEALRALAARLCALAASPRQARAFSFLRALAPSPPRVLLLEGGTTAERIHAALYWALLQACENPAEDASPCLLCPVCLKFLARLHRDFFFLDGTAGSIGIDEVRSVRATLGEPPREARHRVVILAEAQSLTEPAANAMLKSLEEALPATVFVLTTPQRERLLPTLVSRSWVLTLAWPPPLTNRGEDLDQARDADLANGAEQIRPEDGDWPATLAAFLATGKGLFDRTGARGGVDATQALELILICQRALAQAFAGMDGKDIPPGRSPAADLARFFASLPENRRAVALAVLAEGQESVLGQVNPALVADWVMTRLYLLGPQRRG